MAYLAKGLGQHLEASQLSVLLEVGGKDISPRFWQWGNPTSYTLFQCGITTSQPVR